MYSELQSGSQLPAQACLTSLTLIGDTDIYLEGVEQSDPVTSVLEKHLGPEVTGRTYGSLGRVMTPSPQLAGPVSWHSPRQEGKLAYPSGANDSYTVVPRAPVMKPHTRLAFHPLPPVAATRALRTGIRPRPDPPELSILVCRNSERVKESHSRAWGQ